MYENNMMQHLNHKHRTNKIVEVFVKYTAKIPTTLYWQYVHSLRICLCHLQLLKFVVFTLDYVTNRQLYYCKVILQTLSAWD